MKRLRCDANGMAPRQQYALANPVDPKDLVSVRRFAKTFTIAGRRFETILTVDRVKGEFFWHARVSVLDIAFKPIPRKNLDKADLGAAKAVARILVMGVGQPSADKIMYDEKTLQIRRPLTIQEERMANP
jgi:hypothetical protein